MKAFSLIKFIRNVMVFSLMTTFCLSQISCDYLGNDEIYLLETFANKGKITKNPDKERYKKDEDVTLSVASNIGYLFIGWDDDASGTDTIINITMDRDKKVTAKFSHDSLVIDIDGNIYHTIKIGDQVWTVENLRVTHYNDGTKIPLIEGSSGWEYTENGAYCYYDNISDTDIIAVNGALYNYFAVETEKLAPIGWHIPTENEWNKLIDYLIENGFNWDGTTTGNKVAKALASYGGWRTSTIEGSPGNNYSSNNSSGFKGLPVGYRDPFGDFLNRVSGCRWWTTNYPVSFTSLSFDRDSISRIGSIYEESGRSVRIILN